MSSRNCFKVVHIISGDLWAGAEVMVVTLIRNLIESDEIKVEAIVFNDNILFERLKNYGVRTYLISETQHNSFQIAKKLSKIFKENQPDIIHTHKYKGTIVSALALFGKQRPKLIRTVHGFTELYQGIKNFRMRIYNLINHFILNHYFDKVVVVSNEIRELLLSNRRIVGDKLEIIHNGIDIPLFNGESYKKKNTVVIGSAGRFVPVKNYPFLIALAKQVIEKNKRVKFVLVGDGPQKSILLKELSNSNMAGGFKISPFTNNMEDFYNNINIFINTSFHEGIPLTILEAMAFSLPIIAPNVGGIPEIIENGKEGFLVEPNDLNDFVEKCCRLIDNNSLRLKMGEAARQKVETKFSAIQMTQKYIRLYKKMLAD